MGVALRWHSSFPCPHCLVLASHQHKALDWIHVGMDDTYDQYPFVVSTCLNCKEPTFWKTDKIIYPTSLIPPVPHVETPLEIAEDYKEARNVFDHSPRASAALLRLAVQKLCKVLGEPGKNINEDIGSLVKRGLPQGVKEALDSVRVIGNNAVHPGEIEVHNEPDLALALFDLVNLIVDRMISEPKKIKAIHDRLPESIRKAIDRRDAGN